MTGPVEAPPMPMPEKVKPKVGHFPWGKLANWSTGPLCHVGN